MKAIKKSTQMINASGRDFELSYYILIEEGVNNNKEYGIRITKDEEKSEVFCITDNEQEIEKLINMLSENQVLPVHLLDVLEDIM